MFGRKARLYPRVPTVPVSDFILWTRDVGDAGRLRCLHSKADTTMCVRTCSVGSAQCSGCVVCYYSIIELL